MDSEVAVRDSLAPFDRADVDTPLSEEERRQYNREYMRRWRSHADHQRDERGRRRRSYYQRKSLAALQDAGPGAGCEDRNICGFCRLKRSVGAVERLLINEDEPSGFISILVPYCGEC